MPSLLDMTKVPMINILEQCDFKSVYGEEWDYINYVKVDHRECLLENSKSLDDLEDILKNKPRPLQTEKLEFTVSRGSEALKILPYLDSKVLKHITLMTPKGVREVTPNGVGEVDEIERIMELDQFKNASGLIIHDFLVNADLKRFFHFKRICVQFQDIPLKDLVALKVALTTSTHMKDFSFLFYKMDTKQFEKQFGVPSKDIEPADDEFRFIDKTWYFKMKTSKVDVLEIHYTCYGLSFRRMKATDVEKDLVVKD